MGNKIPTNRSDELTDESRSRQNVSLEEIPTWAEDFNRNRVELERNVAPADEQVRQLYAVDWEINNKVSLYEGDITYIEADGIVSCCGRSLQPYGGVSLVIEQAAGGKLTDELANLNGCPTGEAKTTAGYKLPAEYIIHTVGPVDKNQQLLDKCYTSCLEQMNLKQMKSLVFCCISTGAYGYPSEEAAQVALKRVRLWLEEKKKRQALDQIDRIVFCLFTPKDISAYKAWTQVYFPCGSEESYKEWLLQEKMVALEPLEGFIQITTTEPDMITLDDDPNSRRAKMPCGHVIGPDSMTEYFRDILKTGKFKFNCPSPNCNREWDYFLVRHVACLTEEEMLRFEKKLEHNYLQKEKGKQQCPGCKTWCERAPGAGKCVRCPICTASKGKKFDFCWICLNEWNSSLRISSCGNPGCSGKDNRIQILSTCSTKMINNCLSCPTIRGCPKCGILIKHKSKCGHVNCSNCGNGFCFICLKCKKDGEWQCKTHFCKCKLASRQTSLPGTR